MIPIKYNVRSLFVRKANTLMTIVSIAFVVLVYVGVLALGAGLRVAFSASGDSSTVIVLRDGANSEMESYFPTETHRILASMPGVARDADGEPLASGETMTLQILERPTGLKTQHGPARRGRRRVRLRPYIRSRKAGVSRRANPKSSSRQLEGEVGTGTRQHDRSRAVHLHRVGIFDSGGSSYGSESGATCRNSATRSGARTTTPPLG